MKILGVISDNKMINIQNRIDKNFIDWTEETTSDINRNNPEYIELAEKTSQAFEKLKTELTQEQYHAFLEYDCVRTAEESYMLTEVYREAFQDGAIYTTEIKSDIYKK